MSVFARIQTDLIAALKRKDETVLSTLRTLKAAMQKVMIDTKTSPDDDAATIAVLKQEAKKREDSMQTYRQGGREDLATKEQAELAVIQQYLPAQLSDDAVRTGLQEVIAAADTKDFGALMKQAMQHFHGQADGKQVSAILKQLLSV